MTEYIARCHGGARFGVYSNRGERIIRCADCAYRDPERELYGKGWCRTNVRYVRDKDYCAWAEPKDGAE